jgi:hypothetical protein
MAGMGPEEARHFYEEDEDPSRVFAQFDAAEKGRTAPPGNKPAAQHTTRRPTARKQQHSSSAATLRYALTITLHQVAALIERFWQQLPRH